MSILVTGKKQTPARVACEQEIIKGRHAPDFPNCIDLINKFPVTRDGVLATKSTYSCME